MSAGDVSARNVSGLFNLNVNDPKTHRPPGLEGQAPSATTVASNNIYDPKAELDKQALMANSVFCHTTA